MWAPCSLLLLLASGARARSAPAQCPDFEGQLWQMKQSVSNLVPRDVYRLGIQRSMGDHVDWSKLEAYRISDAAWKRELVEEVDDIFTKFLEAVEEWSKPPTKPYEHSQLFRAPDNVNDLWLSEVSLASDLLVHSLDKANMVLQGGVFSPQSHRFFQYSSTSEKHQLELLRQLSETVNEVLSFEPEIGKYLEVMRNEGFQQAFMEELEGSLETNVACYYSMLATKNLTFYNIIMQNVPEAELVKLTQDFVAESFRVINSLDAEFNLKKVIVKLKEVFKALDFDTTTSKVFLSLLRVRTLVIGIDIHEVFENLDQVHRQIGEGVWRLTTGHWPELLQFIQNFVDKTIKSERFWKKVDEVFQEIVADAKMKYIERGKVVEDTITHKLKPFLRDLLDTMRQVQVKDGPLVTQLVDKIDSFELTPVDQVLDTATTYLSKTFLSCYTHYYGKPDFDQLSSMVASNPVVRFLRPVVEADWPERQEVPARLPAFLVQLQDLVLLLATSILGECSRPVARSLG